MRITAVRIVHILLLPKGNGRQDDGMGGQTYLIYSEAKTSLFVRNKLQAGSSAATTMQSIGRVFFVSNLPE